jgi:hypothetical protein
MLARTTAAIKAAFTLESFIGALIWYGISLLGPLILSAVLELPWVSFLSLAPLGIFLLMMGLRARREGRWPFEAGGVPGWDSKVTELTPSEKYPLWALMFRLYGPAGRPAEGEVTCEVDFDGNTYLPKAGNPRFDDVNLQPGELPHYVAFFPESFDAAERRDGDYELR